MAAKKHRGLGRGLDSLIPIPDEKKIQSESIQETGYTAASSEGGAADQEAEGDTLRTVRITKVEPNRNQPRTKFDEEKLQELADSIRENGLLEPIIVTDEGSHYEIVAGERRWRACKLAGLKEIQVIVRQYDSDLQKARNSLIENIQREDLNPIEEAKAYQRLIDEFHVKQDEIAKQVSKKRSTIANSLRLLKLQPEVQEMVMEDQLSMGHARALLAVEDREPQMELARRVISQKLSVRETERLAASLGRSKKEPAAQDETLELIYRDVCSRINSSIGMKVNIKSGKKAGGKLEIEFASQDDLDKLMDRLIR